MNAKRYAESKHRSAKDSQATFKEASTEKALEARAWELLLEELGDNND